MKPKVKKYKIDRDVLEALVLPPESHIVIVHVPHQNKDTTTKSGIYIVGDQDFKPAEHAERWGYIYKLPPGLLYEYGDPDTMSWKTEIECEVGDKVWFDFREALYAYTFEVDGEWYKLMSYEGLHVAQKPDGKVIPLNGYLLMKEYRPPKVSQFSLDPPVDARFGIVEIAGRPNDDYMLDVFSDDIDVYDGDHVLFEHKTSCFPLEATLHQEFSDVKYILQQRKKVIAVVDKEHKETLRLHRGVFAMKMRKDEMEVGGITLLKGQRRLRYGDVVESANDDIPVGSLVVVSKQPGTMFNDLEYFTEDQIYYYEKA